MYKAVMLLRVEVHPVTNNKCTGQVVSSEELKQYGIQSKQVLVIEAENKADCLTKVANFIKACQ